MNRKERFPEKYHLEPIDSAEKKQIMLQIICEIMDFCKEQGLRCSLDAGTLLGAARHQGFIPWDDDADVLMPREDYERFLRSFNERAGDSRIFCVSHLSSKEYYYPFAKVCDLSTVVEEERSCADALGVWVDLFPVDTFSDPERILKRRKRQGRAYGKVLRFSYRNSEQDTEKPLKRAARRFLCKIGIVRLIFSYQLWLIRGSAQKDGKYAWNISCAPEGGIGKITREFFDEYTELPFEGKMFSCIRDYDRFLTLVYGDWHQLPPPEERCTKHVTSQSRIIEEPDDTTLETSGN